MAGMHEVDYKVFGEDIQFVEIELDPGEAAVAEAGGMFYMEDGITMETVFGDGSQQRTTFVDALIGAGKRLLVGESLFMTVFLNSAQGKKRVSFAAPYPGRIVPIKLSEIGGELITQKDAFLAAAKGVTPGQLALAWLLAQGNDVAPIPGTKRRTYLAENLGALDVVLSASELAELDEAFPPDAVAGQRYTDSGMGLVGK